MQQELESVRDALLEAGDSHSAGLVSAALAGGDDSVREFVVSNELWGGSGSIADQGGAADSRDDARRSVEAALVSLGRVQLRAGVVNVRTSMWVETFDRWHQDGI